VGRFRADRALINGSHFIPPGSRRFPDLIPKMLELANAPPEHLSRQAPELLYNLVAAHLGSDGDGRSARLPMNFLLLRHDYPLTIIDVPERSEYLASLEEANAGRCELFSAFILHSIVNSVRKLSGENSPS
jgi:Fic family protein